MRTLIAKWNPARDVWETEQGSLFCEHSAVLSGTFPRSGMTVGGQLFALPPSEPATNGNGSSLLPSPRASDTTGPGEHGQGGADLRTVIARDTSGEREHAGTRNGHFSREIPTPRRVLSTADATSNRRDARRPESAGIVGGSDAAISGRPVVADRDWGIYRPAVERWGAVLGRPAPNPITTGVKGGQQLSGRLTEWMMGLPDGWVTDVPGISNNDAIKLSGNGVVPQQCAYALRLLTEVVSE